MANRPEKVISTAIPFFSSHERWMIVGGGADNTHIELLKQKKAREIVHVDISERMSRKSALRLKRESPFEEKVDFKVTPFLDFQTNQKFDAIVFPFYLDLFEEAEIMADLEYAATNLNPGGSLYIVDFQYLKKSSWWYKLKSWGLYMLFWPVTKVKRNAFPNFAKICSTRKWNIERLTENYNGFYASWKIKIYREELPQL